MYAWYENAQVCFAYLADVPSTVDLTSDYSELTRTVWATRGWTLQELLAPQEVIFFSSDWHEIGNKVSLSGILSAMTGVDEEYLRKENSKRVWSASVAERMSWAARRTTSRPEDIAYCLMGLFQVNMPMLYGEGKNAFIRLQEEIMKRSDDHSLFAWTDFGQPEDAMHGLLATHPKYFDRSRKIVPYEDREVRSPFSMTNRGLCIELHLSKIADSLWAATLDCPVPPTYDDSSFLAIYLKELSFSHGQYARVKVGSFGKIHERGRLETVYVRQSIVAPDIKGFFPTHVLHLRRFIRQDVRYRVVQTIPKSPTDVVKPIGTTQRTSWIPERDPIACRITSKGDSCAFFVVHIVFEERESILILLGTANLQVGFTLSLMDSPELTDDQRQNLFTTEFVPFTPGSKKLLGYHRICISAEPIVASNSKYYMIDIQIEAMDRPRNLLDENTGAFEDLVAVEPISPKRTRWTVVQKFKQPFSGRKPG